MKIDLFGSQGESWNDAISALAAQNWIAENSTDKSKVIFRQAPGSENYLSKDTDDKIHRIYAINSNSDIGNRLYYVWYDNSATAYKVSVYYNNLGVMTNRDIGTLTGATGSFSNMVHDETAEGGKVVVADTGGNTLWYVTMDNTISSDTVTAYTLPTGWAIQYLTFQDSYFFGNIIDTGTNNERRKVVRSDFGTHTFTSTNFYQRTSAAGNVVRTFSDNREIWVLCDDSIELLYNSQGTSEGFGFLRNNSAYIDIGVVGGEASVLHRGILYFFGLDQEGRYGVYRMNGYNPELISNQRFNEDISGVTYTELKSAFMHPLKTTSSDMIVLNTTGGSWAYNIDSGAWGHFEYDTDDWPYAHDYAFFMSNETSVNVFGLNILIRSDLTSGGGGTSYSQTQHLDNVSSSVYTWYDYDAAGTDTIPRELISRHIFAEDNNLLAHDIVRLEFAPATNLAVTLSYSDDDGATWTSAGAVTQSEGIYTWRAMGASRDRLYKITTSTSVESTLISSWVKARPFAA